VRLAPVLWSRRAKSTAIRDVKLSYLLGPAPEAHGPTSDQDRIQWITFTVVLLVEAGGCSLGACRSPPCRSRVACERRGGRRDLRCGC